ncbi:hypothetical protein SRABI126_05247 [Pedobacter sp. Bi126]|nr:hypothetical protein SRABI126_05247 [Pedobacter sp. Bi126]
MVTVGSSGVPVEGSSESLSTPFPLGSLPVALAWLVTLPPSISDWVIVCTAVKVTEAPGARLATGEPVTTALASLTAMSFKVTLPVLVTIKLYLSSAPKVFGTVPFTDFARLIDGAAGIMVTVGSSGVPVEGSSESLSTPLPLGSLPVALAWLVTLPPSRSDWVIVCTAVKVTEAPGARLATGEPVTTALASLTAILLKVTLPVLVTTKLYLSSAPTVFGTVPFTDFARLIDGVYTIGVTVQLGHAGVGGVTG